MIVRIVFMLVSCILAWCWCWCFVRRLCAQLDAAATTVVTLVLLSAVATVYVLLSLANRSHLKRAVGGSSLLMIIAVLFVVFAADSLSARPLGEHWESAKPLRCCWCSPAVASWELGVLHSAATHRSLKTMVVYPGIRPLRDAGLVVVLPA